VRRPPEGLARALAEAGATAALGLLAAVAVGAVATAGLDLLVPEVLAAGSAPEALRYSVWLGLASLNVPLDAAGIAGDAAPLTGAAAAFWTIASSVRRRSPGWAAASSLGTAVTAVAFAGLCGLAAATSHTVDAGASPGWSLVYGLTWGGVAAAAGRSAALRDAAGAEPPAGRVAAARSLVALALAAGGLAAAWLLAAGVVAGATGATVSRLLGPALLTVAFAPNVLGAVVALGAGARVELVLADADGTVAAPEGLALWDWGGGIAPWYVLILVLVPLLATIAAAALTPHEAPLRRGLRTGLALGLALFVLSRAGSLAATVPGTAAGIRLGVDGVPAFGLGVAWGVAGSFLALALPRAAHPPRLGWR
jgi:hypothetical protein